MSASFFSLRSCHSTGASAAQLKERGNSDTDDEAARLITCFVCVFVCLQHNNVPVVRLAEGFQENLVPIGIMNGEVVYSLPLVSAAPPPNTSSSQKRKRDSQEDDGRPYIKKPPNAFMIFRDEQRPKVTAELNDNNSATPNTILGQRWKSLSKEEQAKYYEQAEKERRLHAQRHPDWSCSQNYGKKRKRVRRKAPTRAEASECEPEEVTQQVKRLCVTNSVLKNDLSLGVILWK
ncbi:transcription factor 7-like 1-B isoform X2 [Trachinotus anak]|uniref:transcription factor 7-like 1-B isoform X2 n=2 Tax=Trachinotus anak TaxID=443729 RepID=UPI0039F1B837